MADSYTCKVCKKKVTKIGIASVCRQTYHLGSDSYTDLEVEETINGFCIECANPIPAKDLKRLTGLKEEVVTTFK